MVLAKVLPIRDGLTAHVSDVLRVVLGAAERVRVVKDQEVVIDGPSGEVRASAVELVALECDLCSERTYVRYNTQRCAYCGSIDPKHVRAIWAEGRTGLVPLP